MEGVDYHRCRWRRCADKIAQAGQDVGIDLYLARVKPQVMEVLQRDGLIDQIGADYFHDDISAAVAMHLRKYPADVLRATRSQAAG